MNYRRQAPTSSGTVPDFTFLLPEDLELRMDVKFPIDNYLRLLDADDDLSRASHTKAFVRDVRNRIRELQGRRYIEPGRTVECVLLFIPNEAVYSFVLDADPGIVDAALGQKVVLCAPSSLFGVLAVVRQSVEQFQLERTSDEILECLGAVVDQWQRFGEHVDKVERQLDTVSRSMTELQGTRRRQIEKQFDEIDRLRGARADGPTPVGPASAVPGPAEVPAPRLGSGMRVDPRDGAICDVRG